MPNRVLRDWTNSERFDELSEGAEVFFTRLIMKADDFGGFYGNTKLLKSHLFPLKEFKHTKISDWIQECVKIGIICYYEVDSKNYIRINDFGQRTRIMKSKFPEPPTNDGQLSDIGLTDDGLKPKPNQTEVETNPKPNKETESEVNTHPDSDEQDTTKPFQAKRFLKSLGVDDKLADEYLAVRKLKRLKNTLTAFESLKIEIEKTGVSPPEIIKLCVINSWGGFKSNWDGWKHLKSGSTTPTKDRRQLEEEFFQLAEAEGWDHDRTGIEFEKRFNNK